MYSFLPWSVYGLGSKWMPKVDLNGYNVEDLVHDVNNVYGHTCVSQWKGKFLVGTYKNY